MSQQIAANVLSATFDPALAQNAGLNVDVALPLAVGGSARLVIKSLGIVSEENLAWDILFWGKAVHGATYDTDTYLGHWAFVAGDAIQYSSDEIANAYRYFIPGLGQPYQDLDAVNARVQPMLHITLVPRGAAHVIHKKLMLTFFLVPEVAWSQE